MTATEQIQQLLLEWERKERKLSNPYLRAGSRLFWETQASNLQQRKLAGVLNFIRFGPPFGLYPSVETLKNKVKLTRCMHFFDIVNTRAMRLFTLYYFQRVNFGKTFDS